MVAYRFVRPLLFVVLRCALPLALLADVNAAQAGAPKISVVSTRPQQPGREAVHLNGDPLQVGARYRIVVTADSETALMVSGTGSREYFHTSHATPGRPLQLPFGGGWYTVSASSEDIRLVASQGGASTTHIIRPVDSSTPRTGVFDAAARGGQINGQLRAAAMTVPVPAQDFQKLFKRYRAVALGLGNIKEPPSRDGAAVFRQASPSVVVVQTDIALGSGVLVAPGAVVTNWHVVENAKTINIALKPVIANVTAPPVLREAKLVRYDQVADLALVHYEGPYAPSLKLADESKLEVGNTVHAIGHPEGNFWSYTQGVISQIRPDFPWEYEDGTKHVATVIQTQTPINPGNSGGPLLDDNAAVVGITSYTTPQSDGLNFAVSVSEIKRLLASTENRIAPKADKPKVAEAAPKVKPVAAATGCEPKALNAYVDATGRQVTLIDTTCQGRANVVAFADKTGSRPEYALIDALGERKVAIKIVFNFRDKTNLWIFYGRRDGVPTAYGYEYDGAGRPGRIVAVDNVVR